MSAPPDRPQFLFSQLDELCIEYYTPTAAGSWTSVKFEHRRGRRSIQEDPFIIAHVVRESDA